MNVRRSLPRISKIDSKTIDNQNQEQRVLDETLATTTWRRSEHRHERNLSSGAASESQPTGVTRSCGTFSALLLLRMLPRSAIPFRAESISPYLRAATPDGQDELSTVQMRLQYLKEIKPLHSRPLQSAL